MPLKPSSDVPKEAGAIANFLQQRVRTVADWPQPGVQFRDITPLLDDPLTLRLMIDALAARYREAAPTHIAGLEARGFILGPALAYILGAGFIPIRKKGKLPAAVFAEEYALEYGQATLEIHRDACGKGDRVVLVDDLIATGGTMAAGWRLLERLGAQVIEAAAIIDLPDLGGSAALRTAGYRTFSLCEFSGH